MGSGLSQLFPCFNQAAERAGRNDPDSIFTASEPLDETLGHSFCYVRSSARFLSPTSSDRFLTPTQSGRLSPSQELDAKSKQAGFPEIGFKAISGASVSANISTSRTVIQLENSYDDATDSVGCGFESTSSFSALPLQPVPRGVGGGEPSSFFMSGPIERGGGALSGPLESEGGKVPFSAPLGGVSVKKKRKKGISGIRNALSRNSSEKKRLWVVPVRNFMRVRKEQRGGDSEGAKRECNKVQWALGKAGEDRVHVVISEEPAWLFVGIYDGFNGPDAPEFLMSNLYKAVCKELEGLFWDSNNTNQLVQNNGVEVGNSEEIQIIGIESKDRTDDKSAVTNEPRETGIRGRKLWEFLAEGHPGYGLDLSGSDRFAFSVTDALSLSKRSHLLAKLKNGLSRNKESTNLFPWRFWLEAKEKNKAENVSEERSMMGKVGPVDHDLVLGSMSRALEVTELAYLGMTNKVLDRNPELALMGSCLLVVLMRDEDVYVMNVGDSRAIVAQYEPEQEGIVQESTSGEWREDMAVNEILVETMRVSALQLSTDHSTNIEEEIIRIKNEHPDDSRCIVNDRVKGRLKVTRAFGAGFLKQPELNAALLEMFRNDYIGTTPYISCSPSLRHHKLCPRDQFLVLSSDGLYQYFTNAEVVSHVESFMDKFPDGDPAQNLIEELLLRAAKKAGMEFHELLDIPQGDRRKYHDDVTVMVISLEGRIWKSSG